jgi:hypothetical protein
MTIDIRKLRFLAALIAAISAAAGIYAFTNSNTVPATNAGSGATAISGYTVSNVAYTLNADPTKIDAVTFTLDKAAGTVKAQLVSAGTWYACTNTASFDWSCDTTSPQAGVAPANMLTVLAVQ